MTPPFLRGFWRGEKVEVGDVLEPNYVHYFHQEEIRSELRERAVDQEELTRYLERIRAAADVDIRYR